MRRGEIYWADLAPRSGSEQMGRRPVIILSDDAFNERPHWRSVIVVPMTTSALQAQRRPTVIDVPAKALGLKRDGFALCHQVTTLDRSKLTRLVGVLPRETLRAVEHGLKAAMDLD